MLIRPLLDSFGGSLALVPLDRPLVLVFDIFRDLFIDIQLSLQFGRVCEIFFLFVLSLELQPMIMRSVKPLVVAHEHARPLH